jgi:hypothetical protein
MGKRSSFYLKQTDIKASKGFDKFLSGHLVKATRICTKDEWYGIVIPFEKIIIELNKRCGNESSQNDWGNCIWAIWCKSPHIAVKEYENVYDEQFVPKSFTGRLNNLSPRDFEFTIVDL